MSKTHLFREAYYMPSSAHSAYVTELLHACHTYLRKTAFTLDKHDGELARQHACLTDLIDQMSKFIYLFIYFPHNMPSRQKLLIIITKMPRGASFQLFLGGQIFYFIFNATGLLKNWKKQLIICSNLTSFIVPFFLFLFFSLFPLFLSFFLSFFLFPWGSGPQPPKWRLWMPVARRQRKVEPSHRPLQWINQLYKKEEIVQY